MGTCSKSVTPVGDCFSLASQRRKRDATYASTGTLRLERGFRPGALGGIDRLVSSDPMCPRFPDPAFRVRTLL